MVTSLKNLSLAELASLLTEWGEPAYRAQQIARWLFQAGVDDVRDMSNLPLKLRQRLAENFTVKTLQLVMRQPSGDGSTVKYLWRLYDDQAIESVLLKHSYGRAVCVSTQVGCRMGCAICASAGGYVRNLMPGEMYDQVLQIQKDCGQRITHVVLMGTGEPLDNLPAVLIFLEHLHASYGLHLSWRHITVSTCGLVPGIYELARQRLPLTLAVSLHAPTDELRNRLMPINRRFPLSELVPACREYAALTRRRVTFEYALLEGINDDPTSARRLAELCRGWLVHVNLIPYNPVPTKDFRRPSPQRINQFYRLLQKEGIAVTLRRELGSDIAAACGQLRRRYLQLASGEER